jgi:hypothetical protein
MNTALVQRMDLDLLFLCKNAGMRLISPLSRDFRPQPLTIPRPASPMAGVWRLERQGTGEAAAVTTLIHPKLAEPPL